MIQTFLDDDVEWLAVPRGGGETVMHRYLLGVWLEGIVEPSEVASKCTGTAHDHFATPARAAVTLSSCDWVSATDSQGVLVSVP